MESNQIVVSSGSNSVAAYHKQATDVAGVCKDIVQETAQKIGGRKYVRVEGWQAIATAHGCVASARDVERIEGGWRAIGEVRRMDNGNVIATAEGFLGEDEPVWAKRPEYAKRAMCQTRAISRACRSAFAHVVVLIGGGLETTPAEEVPSEGFADNGYSNGNGHKPAPRLVDAEIVEEPRIISRDMKTGEYRREGDEPKKRNVPQLKEPADYETVTFLKRSKKQGEGKKGPWTRWGRLCTRENGNEEWVNTFAGEFGELIDKADEGQKFNVRLKVGERGTDIIDLYPGDIPTKAEAQMAAKDIEWGNGKEAEDDSTIPF